MKIWRAAVLLGVVASAGTGQAAVTGVTTQEGGQVISTDKGTLRLQVFSPDVIRVTYAAGIFMPELKSYTVVATPARVKFDAIDSPETVGLSTGRIQAQVDRKTGAVSFIDAKGQVIL